MCFVLGSCIIWRSGMIVSSFKINIRPHFWGRNSIYNTKFQITSPFSLKSSHHLLGVHSTIQSVMKTAQIEKYTLQFKQPGGTSRGVLHTKDTYILQVFENNQRGIGECALFRGLSADDVPEYEEQLAWLRENINLTKEEIIHKLYGFPSIIFGYEQAMLNLKYQNDLYFPSAFTEGKQGITINGLIWMGDARFMKSQIKDKLEKGFSCLKLKIGVDWESEKEILKQLRNQFPKEILELRVDANGAFSYSQAWRVLEELNALEIHSIEQPIKKMTHFHQNSEMKQLCAETPTPIALDEELIGVHSVEEKQQLLECIMPQYIILKPSLVGGISGCDEWIAIAEKLGIGWWITSALESNIGLNAIAQYTFTKNNSMPQGLGTGGLFTNNFPSPLYLEGEVLRFQK